MNYWLVFAGGPMDGNRERGCGPHFHTIIGRQPVASGLINLAVYGYRRSNATDTDTERIYEFIGTFPVSEARERIGDSRTL
jgi:hypothetical protein